MSDDNTAPAHTTGAVEALQAAFTEWQQGNQQPAIDRIKERADSGEEWAIALLVWLYSQQGPPGFMSAVPYAKRATALGMPWATSNLFNNIIANITASPELLDAALDLLDDGPTFAPAIEPVSQAWNLLTQSQPESAMRLLQVRTPHPTNPAAWAELTKHAHSQTQQLKAVVESAAARQEEVETVARQTSDEIERVRDNLQTQAKQAGLLISSVNSDAANVLFDAEATRNEKESRFSWRWGIGVLAAAAFVGVLPLLLHYLGQGPTYSSAGLLLAHAASTAALGTVAGVLLARARGRDRARQRARDLSTAMGTMISYSNQIQDDQEKQQFMLTMGRLVLQAHLQTNSAPNEESLAGLAALLSALRQTPTAQ